MPRTIRIADHAPIDNFIFNDLDEIMKRVFSYSGGVGEAFVSIVGLFHQKVSPRLWPIGMVVWTLAAIIICAFDEKSFGVGTFILITNTNLGFISLYNDLNIQKKLLNHNISMHIGVMLLLLMIFIRFRSSVFVPFIYQLSVFLINFAFCLIYIILVSVKDSRAEVVKTNDK